MSKKPKNSRAKGSRGERLCRDFLKSLGFEGVKRTQQYNGLADQGDVHAPTIPDVHIEVKVGAVAKWDLGTQYLHEACKQARRDAKGKPWVVLWKPDRKCWRLTAEMQPEGCPRGLATVTDPDTIRAILWSKQISAQGHAPSTKAAKPPKAKAKTSASKPKNPLRKRAFRLA